jgi:hypothetical protein
MLDTGQSRLPNRQTGYSMSDQELFVDAAGPATLFNGPIWIDCATLQEAVMEWHKLPPERAQRASIRLIGGPLYKAAEIARPDYRSKPAE